jgi:hypothetical protein
VRGHSNHHVPIQAPIGREIWQTTHQKNYPLQVVFFSTAILNIIFHYYILIYKTTSIVRAYRLSEGTWSTAHKETTNAQKHAWKTSLEDSTYFPCYQFAVWSGKLYQDSITNQWRWEQSINPIASKGALHEK